MGRFVEGEDRRQGVLLPELLDDYVSEENPVRVHSLHPRQTLSTLARIAPLPLEPPLFGPGLTLP